MIFFKVAKIVIGRERKSEALFRVKNNNRKQSFYPVSSQGKKNLEEFK